MTAHIQHPARAVRQNETTSVSNPVFDDGITRLRSVESRENTLRNLVRKWYGPVDSTGFRSTAAPGGREDLILQTLLRLHRLSCNLVPESLRIPLHEDDVFSAIILLNRIEIAIRAPLAAVVCHCEARSVREKNMRFNQIDPLQLRHLLTYHQEIPHEELNTLDIQRLREACEKSDATAIREWFHTIAKRKAVLPNDAPQFLREMAGDLWNAGYRDFLETYAKETAVLDAALFDELGWENSRLFFALFKRLQGSACRPAGIFLTEADLALAIDQSKRLGESDETVHFRMLSTTYDAPAFRRLERTILAASKESGVHLRLGGESAPPIERKRAVALPPTYGSPEFFARNSARPATG